MPNASRLVNDLARHIGQTVTIFTTSGGQSGRGFTGVLASVNCDFVRLVTQIGPAPGCALGNCCEEKEERRRRRRDHENEEERFQGAEFDEEFENRDRERERERERERFECNGRRGLGAVVDIPTDRIAAFVHNAVGSEGWV